MRGRFRYFTIASAGALVATLGITTPASAGDPATADSAEDAPEEAVDCAVSDDPAVLFRRGQKHYKAGEFEACHACYLKSWKLQPAYDVAANLGNVEIQQLGMYAAGAQHLSYALENLPGSLDADVRAAATKKMRERLELALAKVGRVRAVVEPAGAEVFIDGESVGRASEQEIFLAEGEHVIEVRLPGHTLQRQTVNSEAGVMEKLKFNLEAEGGDAAVGGGPNWPLIAIGGGVALAAIGAGAGMLAASASAGSDRQSGLDALTGGGNANPCVAGTPNSPDACAAIADAGDREVTFQGIGIGLLAGGGAAAIGTVIIGLLVPADGDAEADAVDEAHIQLLPTLGGVQLMGSF